MICTGYLKKEDGTMALAAREVSKMFYGSLSSTIMKIIMDSLESSISQKLSKTIEEKAKEAVKGYMNRASTIIKLEDFKRCSSCGLDNDYKNKFCYEYGTSLEK